MNFCKRVVNIVEPIKMDPANREALNVLTTQGEQKFVEHVFTHPEDREKSKEEQRQLSYAEMRMLYG